MTTNRRDLAIYAGLGAVLITGLIVLFFAGPRFLETAPSGSPSEHPAAAVDARKIRARLFYVDPDGEHLTTVEQEVPYGEGTTVGTLLWVGRGKLTVAGFAEVLAARDRGLAGPSAPAKGLCLVAVRYGDGERRRQDGSQRTCWQNFVMRTTRGSP